MKWFQKNNNKPSDTPIQTDLQFNELKDQLRTLAKAFEEGTQRTDQTLGNLGKEIDQVKRFVATQSVGSGTITNSTSSVADALHLYAGTLSNQICSVSLA